MVAGIPVISDPETQWQIGGSAGHGPAGAQRTSCGDGSCAASIDTAAACDSTEFVSVRVGFQACTPSLYSGPFSDTPDSE